MKSVTAALRECLKEVGFNRHEVFGKSIYSDNRRPRSLKNGYRAVGAKVTFNAYPQLERQLLPLNAETAVEGRVPVAQVVKKMIERGYTFHSVVENYGGRYCSGLRFTFSAPVK